MCKAHVVQEGKKIGSEFPNGVDLQQTQQDILPPVPISTKLDSDDVKQLWICTPIYSLVLAPSRMPWYTWDVKPGAVPVICAPHHVPHVIQPKLCTTSQLS